MANQLRVLLASTVVAFAAFNAVPAVADSAPSVLGSYAEQIAINKTRFILLFDSPVEGLTPDDFQASAGCTIAHLEVQGATAQLELVDCPSGLVELVLLANSVGSSVLGPSENHVAQIEIDAIAPTGTFSEIQIEGSGPFTYSTDLRFSEPVEFDISRLRFISDAGCTNTEVATAWGWRLVAVCDFATLSWSLAANSLQDSAGNRGPVAPLEVSISNLRPSPPPSIPPPPAPAPAPNPEPFPALQAPMPEISTSSPELPESSSPTVSESAEAVSSDSNSVEWDAELVLVTITPPANSEPAALEPGQETLLSALQEEDEPLVVEALKPAVETETKVAIAPVAGDTVKLEDPRRGQWIWLVGLGSLALLANGLIRRFSGR